ncbi:MAG: phosphopantetheine-binding protein [Pseudomonadota bacterium]|jgi:aryl carrier-like protein|uniref:phosphopantetheine-binding protein n=1 Tax=Rhodovulum sp. FJ3 TaxID=3079053 RepID=UPI000C0A65EB|nr:phosphopantetheine-binding protein [Rhodovulum sp. FJ3]MAY32396.1 hypothetical protein [Rhodovulum sp.]MEC8630936.1 phosphopantetheine-binding protein [Pseudomonadota bacterium]MCI5085676.1 phosphopantetheine-binding protein [Rhodovulum sp.]MDV4166511.1 phosphopantetheine-binding protein [Rhodovulum sp. FJ3]MEC8795754.1 phosphopantetheine-binding protein [Pseudomonadota bacterium]|tara:strand:+ start:801 stop:1088 length:288 start_codon:yes stop_codon:yes gene_type:complete
MAITYDDAMSVLQEIFEDLADDLDLEDETLDPNAKILDLGMESISLVYLISELQQHYGLGDALFRKVRDEDRLLKDMSVDDILKSVVELGQKASA